MLYLPKLQRNFLKLLLSVLSTLTDLSDHYLLFLQLLLSVGQLILVELLFSFLSP